MHFTNRSAWNSSQQYKTVLNIIATVVSPPMRVFCPSATYLYLCFIKVIALAPLSVDLCFSITATYVRVLSSVCVFLVARCARVHSVAYGSKDITVSTANVKQEKGMQTSVHASRKLMLNIGKRCYMSGRKMHHSAVSRC